MNRSRTVTGFPNTSTDPHDIMEDMPEDSNLLKIVRSEQVTLEIQQTNAGVRRTLINLEKLACTDAEMIQLQRKTIYV